MPNLILKEQTTIRARLLNILPDKTLVSLTPWKFDNGQFNRDQMIEYVVWHWDKRKAETVRRYMDRGLEVGFMGK